MLPGVRSEEYLYPVPKFDLHQRDVQDFLGQLRGFHEQFAEGFQRSESREHFFNYMAGQFSDLERKSIEPIALGLPDGNVRSLQRFVSEAPWEDDHILSTYRSLVSEDLGSPDGALIFDESGFVKKGADSIGVARQYCGSLGKVDNCQVGVFAAYVSDRGYALVDKRLFIPEAWFTEGYAERRRKCALPDTVAPATKPELAAQMLGALHAEGVLPFRYVLADAVYGQSPTFRAAVEAIPGATYLVQVAKNTTCWLKRPMTITHTYRWRGQPRSKTLWRDTAGPPVSVEAFAANLHDVFWYRREVSEGTKGPIVYEFTRRRVVLADGGLPGPSVWLLVRRTLGADPHYSYFISNASAHIRLKTLVWLSGLRWAIEQCFEETKTELGMDHYEVRKFMGWHHHMLTCMLAHFFLWHLKIRLGKKSTVHYAVAA